MLSTSSRRGRLRRSLLAATVGAVALVVALPGVAYAGVSAVPDSTASVDGRVHGIGKVGSSVVIGGVFSRAGSRARSNVAKILPDGTVDPVFVANTDGEVAAVAASEDGSTVFLGGTFTSVNGVPRANLAAVDATTGAVREGWQADTGGAYPDVRALEVNGNLLYVAGRYVGIDGTRRKRLSAVTVDTGQLHKPFNPRADRGVNEIALTPDRSTLYIAGSITRLGGVPRAAAGSVDAQTGAVTTFAPTGTGGNAVTGALSPDGTRFFYGTGNNTVFAYEPATSNNPVWERKASGNTQAIAVAENEMWIGGHFTGFKGIREKHTSLASLDPATGAVNAWNPQVTGGDMGVWALLLDGPHLHAGGVFSAFDGVQQRGYARFTGTP